MAKKPVPDNYGDPKYWDQRYAKENETFEWLETYESLAQLIKGFVKKQDRIINIGCGNSTIQEEMYDDGYEKIESVDISPVVIEQMWARYK